MSCVIFWKSWTNNTRIKTETVWKFSVNFYIFVGNERGIKNSIYFCSNVVTFWPMKKKGNTKNRVYKKSSGIKVFSIVHTMCKF